jgi:hypothetical protein
VTAPVVALPVEQLEALADMVAARLLAPVVEQPTHESERLLDARAMAERLQVDLKTVYRHAGELGGVKVGGAWRFDPARMVDEPASGVTDRYGSESPQPSKPPAAARRTHARRRTPRPADCQLLPIGRAGTRS